MSLRILCLLYLSAAMLFSPCVQGAGIPVEPYSSQPTAGEMAFVAQWMQFLLKQGDPDSGRYAADLPFSFRCGERSSREWVTLATASIVPGEWRNDRTRTHLLSWKDAQTSLACEMELVEFQDFPAFQWVVRVRNDGQADSAKLHDFWGIDTSWHAADGSMPVLHRSVGSPGHEDDFCLRSEVMHNSMWEKRRRIAMDTPTNTAWGQAHSYLIPNDRRSSAVWMPFFNYQTGGDGLIAGLGWSGAWRAYFDHQGDGKSTILAGVENFDSILHPGETVRSTLNLFLYWQGEMLHGQNMFRRLVLEHYSPHAGGKRVEPPISGVVWGGVPSNEHLEFIEKIQECEIPLDVYWFDAGWYGTGVAPSYSVFEGDWGIMAGDWRPNPNWHNGTLKPVSDAAHAAGMKFLLWVEPCRAIHGRPITLEHPEYFLTGNADGQIRDGQTLLLDLGKPVALKWAIDVVGGLIRDYDIDWYEEDFNLDPNPYLEAAAEPERWGMTEMRFIEGHFAFWDALREAFPHLAILNCASGGRRIDLESIRRGQPLWRSDYNCFPEATAESTQDQSYGIQYWLPIQGSATRGWTILDTYDARSALNPGMESWLVAKTEPEWRQIKASVVQAQRCKKYFSGDYYPLVHEQRSPAAWMAYHLYLPAEREGMIVALRREKSDVREMTFDLLTIDPAVQWTFEDYDSGETWTVPGKQIREQGFDVVIPNRRDSRLIFYSAGDTVPAPETKTVKTDKIVFLGNSITRHAPSEEIGWTGNWGMAASAEEKDYVHLVVQAVTESAGNGIPAPAFKVLNIADFERQYATYAVEEHLRELIDFKPDLLILAIGENVPDLTTPEAETQFYESVDRLLKAFQRDGNPAIIVRSGFWPSSNKDACLKRAAAGVGATFVDISALAKDEANYARSERQIAHAGVGGHPGDRGMKAIADAIVGAIRELQTR